jgi:hypothetical protein
MSGQDNDIEIVSSILDDGFVGSGWVLIRLDRVQNIVCQYAEIVIDSGSPGLMGLHEKKTR